MSGRDQQLEGENGHDVETIWKPNLLRRASRMSGGESQFCFAIAPAAICWSGSFFGETTVALAETTPAFVQEKDNQTISGKTLSVTDIDPAEYRLVQCDTAFISAIT
jgi:hypothetical protein